MPILIWYEHELLAESVFFAALVWACAGWMAWVSESRLDRSAYVHDRSGQSGWLLYASAFPLTRLDTALHAEYKAEIRDLVEEARHRLRDFRIDEDSKWKNFLKSPEEYPDRPLWCALGGDAKRRARIYRELALEGIRSRPDLFAVIATQKIMSSANPDDFKAERFATGRYVRKFEHLFEKYARESPGRLQMLFGLPRNEPIPPYEKIARRIEPDLNSRTAVWLTAYAQGFEPWWRLEEDVSDNPSATDAVDTPTAVGMWAITGAILSFLPFLFSSDWCLESNHRVLSRWGVSHRQR